MTIHQEPNIISTCHNEMFYLVESEFATETNFRYKYDIYSKDGILSSKYTLPYPSTYGKIDISKIISPLLSFDFQYNITGDTSTTNSIVQYDTSVGYNSLIHNQSTIKTGIKYCINSSINNFDANEFIMNGDGRFLTNSPKTIFLTKDDYYTLNYLNGNFGDYVSFVDKLAIQYTGTTSYIELGDYLHTPSTSLEDVGDMLKIVGVGPKNLGITSGSYNIWLVDDNNYRMSEIFTFNIIDTGRYGSYQLAFLNRLGAFSYFTFNGKKEEQLTIERFSYLKNQYSLSNNQWVKDDENGGITNYSNYTKREYTFNSSYLNQDTFDFMEELITSPMVYWIENDTPVQIVITETDWTNLKKVYDKEISFSIKAIKSFNKKVIL